jgi:hypothetical protein
VDEIERAALQAEDVDPDSAAVIAAIDLVQLELWACGGLLWGRGRHRAAGALLGTVALGATV